MGRKRV